MKVEVKSNNAENHRGNFKTATSTTTNVEENNQWISLPFIVIAIGVCAIAFFIIRKCRQSSQSKYEYSAVKTDSCNIEKYKENGTNNEAFLICKRNLDNNQRYKLKVQQIRIGFRTEKNWFTVHDINTGAERLLTLLPLPSTCPITTTIETRDILLDLFRGLQHPYIHPVLDIDFWNEGAAVITPLNLTGSLKDLIYSSFWQNEYERKYISKGTGLPLRTVQSLGRQIIEALLFLKNRNFPSFYHLHSGNIIIQNGVARLAGLENSLFGVEPKSPAMPETLAFGHLLFEMSAGYELSLASKPAHLQIELERSPKVADALELIFLSSRTPSLEELVLCNLFRGVELRELRCASINQIVSPSEVLQLLNLVKNPIVPSPSLRRRTIFLEKKL